MAQAYETMIIIHPEISEEEVNSLVDKLKQAVIESKGDCLKVEKWGNRKLVYKVKGLSKGYFLLVYYLGNPKILQALDTMLRYKEQVLRYQTVRVNKKIDPESIRETESSVEAENSGADNDVGSEKEFELEKKDALEESKEEVAP